MSFQEKEWFFRGTQGYLDFTQKKKWSFYSSSDICNSHFQKPYEKIAMVFFVWFTIPLQIRDNVMKKHILQNLIKISKPDMAMWRFCLKSLNIIILSLFVFISSAKCMDVCTKDTLFTARDIGNKMQKMEDITIYLNHMETHCLHILSKQEEISESVREENNLRLKNINMIINTFRGIPDLIKKIIEGIDCKDIAYSYLDDILEKLKYIEGNAKNTKREYLINDEYLTNELCNINECAKEVARLRNRIENSSLSKFVIVTPFKDCVKYLREIIKTEWDIYEIDTQPHH